MKVKPAAKIVALKLDTKVWSLAKQSQIEVVEKNQPEVGEVIAVGSGKLPVPFKIGSIVAYRKFGEFKFWIEGKEIIFVAFQDILAVLK